MCLFELKINTRLEMDTMPAFILETQGEMDLFTGTKETEKGT